MIATGFWTATHVLIVLNGVLAVAALGTMFVGVLAIRASNRLAASSEDAVGVASDQLDLVTEQIRLGYGQLELERSSLEASIRPVVVDVPVGLYLGEGGLIGQDRGEISCTFGTDQSIDLSVPVRNIGSGPAFVRRALLTTGPGNVLDAEANRRVIPTGELAKIFIKVRPDFIGHGAVAAAVTSVGALAVALEYSDLGGEQRTQTLVHLYRFRSADGHSQGHFLVEQVELFPCDDNWVRQDKPDASSGSAQHG